MVVGHTPQTQGVNCEYNCSIWRIDVGMSSGVLDSRPEVMEILDNKPRAIRGKGDTVGTVGRTTKPFSPTPPLNRVVIIIQFKVQVCE
ncbi:shewanella-like protein phosphatase 1 [Silene latifolia]|uniref:shewanella-like protein phosphatase 1 n=1 Tax=Silene latifolia TaxID=37657 RepID=UPI003D781E66